MPAAPSGGGSYSSNGTSTPALIAKPQVGFPSWGNTPVKSNPKVGVPKYLQPIPKVPSKSGTPKPVAQNTNRPSPRTVAPAPVNPGPVQHSAPAPVAPAPVGPTAAGQKSWLAGDTTYLSQLQQIQAQIAAANAGYDQTTQFANADETAQLNDWQNNKQQGLDSLLNDFAGRGLANSSLYTDAQNQYNTQQDSQRSAIMDALTKALADASGQKQSVLTSADSSKANAMQEAIKRYQASLPSVA